MNNTIKCFFVASVILAYTPTSAQDKVFPGADEKSPSRSEYSTWINNTNEGATEQQTLDNLAFFQWLHDEYGMTLDIYAFDAGLIDGKNFYGTSKSNRFKEKFPQGLNTIFHTANNMNTRFGIWGGPDGFGNTKEETEARKEEMISLCRDYHWELFKFDAVCGKLRSEKENDFIDMMEQCRRYSPDLILLNHRLGLEKAKPYATTFLWGGQETYIDVHTSNNTTAPHNRAGALERGLVPNLQRLTEDCGVCLSSCLDYWDDDLILQAFNRSLILAPEIYGNPWLLNDDEYPKLARIFNLHKQYASILVNGMVLPDSYGPFPVARGDGETRLITLRNLTWNTKSYTLQLNQEIGLSKGREVEVRQYHPTEKLIGHYKYGTSTKVSVAPFSAALFLVTTKKMEELGVNGVDYEVIKNITGEPLQIKLLGLPGSNATVQLTHTVTHAEINGKPYPLLDRGKNISIHFDGTPLKENYHRKLCDLKPTQVPTDANALYEATVFSADNNALEVRSLIRSGETHIPAVQKAREAFFNQSAFVTRGVWDKNLFDGNMNTGFYPTSRYNLDQRIKGGCFRLDLGDVLYVDSIVVRVKDEFALQPLLIEEGNFAQISTNLNSWNTITYLAQLSSSVPIHGKLRYLKLPDYPNNISEVEIYANGEKLNSTHFRANNLFANDIRMKCIAAWSHTIQLQELAPHSYLSVAINGEHGKEGAYAALKVDGKYVGAPSRAVSYPSNTWEFRVANSSSNYTYYFPLTSDMINKKIEVVVMAYNADKLDLKPEVWISSYPTPYKTKTLIIEP